jgi:hypothetical protein
VRQSCRRAPRSRHTRFSLMFCLGDSTSVDLNGCWCQISPFCLLFHPVICRAIAFFIEWQCAAHRTAQYAAVVLEARKTSLGQMSLAESNSTWSLSSPFRRVGRPVFFFGKGGECDDSPSICRCPAVLHDPQAAGSLRFCKTPMKLHQIGRPLRLNVSLG